MQQQYEAGTQTEELQPTAEPAVSATEPPKTPQQQQQQRPISSRSSRQSPKTPQQQRPKTAQQQQQQLQQRPATAAVAASSDRLPSARPKTAASGIRAPPTPSPTTQQQQKQQQQPRLLQQQQPKSFPVDRTPMVFSFNPDPRLRSWQRLEHMRLHKMGLSSKLSRRYNVSRVLDFQPVGQCLPEAVPPGLTLPALPETSFYNENARKKNEVAPFRTFQKPTCGVFFSYDTQNRKLKHDLEATDLIKWRYFL